MCSCMQALKTFGDEVAIAFSGAEDVAVIEYAHLTGRPFRVFSLDTGRLNPETYRLFDKVEKRYGIHIEYMFPDTAETEELGYDSIGCEPCTRPVLPNQHEREGRWWWEDATAKECGLHSGNVMDSAVEGAKEEAGDLYTSSNVVEVSKDEMEKMATAGADVSTMAVIYAPWCQFCQGLEPAYEEVAAQLQGSGVRVAKFRGDTEREFVADRFQLQTFPRIVFFPKAGAKEFVAYPSDRRDVDNLMAFVHALQ
eukprot:jgi/Pico_ML_1/51093/g2181.t1